MNIWSDPAKCGTMPLGHSLRLPVKTTKSLISTTRAAVFEGFPVIFGNDSRKSIYIPDCRVNFSSYHANISTRLSIFFAVDRVKNTNLGSGCVKLPASRSEVTSGDSGILGANQHKKVCHVYNDHATTEHPYTSFQTTVYVHIRKKTATF